VLELPDIMLCAVSSVAIEQTVAALERSCRNIAFGDVALLSDIEPQLTPRSAIRWQPIAPLRSKEAYSHFMIKELNRHATRPFVLVVQWDGYVLDHRRWNPAFLDFDYIGAPWPQFDDGMTVGNGGFSLRSRRLLDIVASDGYPPLHPEDTAICRTWRSQLEQRHGICFADPALANAFSSERSGNPRESFGFHGLFNLPDTLPVEELKEMIAAMPASTLHGIDGADLILRLALRGHRAYAWKLLTRRLRSAPMTWKQARLFSALARNSLLPKEA